MNIENRTFSKLFVEYHSKFVRFANGYVQDLPMAEDIVSDAIIYYWENRLRLPDDTNVPAYILTTIKNKCLNQLEHIRIKDSVFTEMMTNTQWELSIRIATLSALEPTDIYTREIYEIVNKTLKGMPEISQLIFNKSRFSHLSNKEIAADLKISVKTVEAHITSVIKLLRAELGDYFLLVFIFLR